MRKLLSLCFCLWGGMSCNAEEEDKEGKKQIVVGGRSLVGATIVQGWLVICEDQYLYQWEL